METNVTNVEEVEQGFSLTEWYTNLMERHRDRRADNLPLMWSIWPTVLICLTYLIIVLYAGPRWMRDRKPYQVKGLMLAYNLFQTLFSAWGFWHGARFYVTGDWSWTCQPIDFSDNPEAIRALHMAWWFYISKFVDLMDSFFFILNKKFSHLSFLHVFHHGIMPFQTWWGPRFIGGGHGGFGAFVNAGVHTVMYLYYLLAAYGPQLQKYLWWKRYLTTLQMVQFVVVFIHALLPLYFSCDYPAIVAKIILVNTVVFFILFSNFYFFAYIRRKTRGKVE